MSSSPNNNLNNTTIGDIQPTTTSNVVSNETSPLPLQTTTHVRSQREKDLRRILAKSIQQKEALENKLSQIGGSLKVNDGKDLQQMKSEISMLQKKAELKDGWEELCQQLQNKCGILEEQIERTEEKQEHTQSRLDEAHFDVNQCITEIAKNGERISILQDAIKGWKWH